MSTQKSKWSTQSKVLTGVAALFFTLTVAVLVLMLVVQAGSPELPLLTSFIGVGLVFMARRARRSDSGIVPKELKIPAAALFSSANPHERILLIGGAAAIVVGAIAGFSGAAANADSAQGNRIMVALGGLQFYDADAGTEFSGWVIFGVVIAVIGVALLAVFVSIRAIRQPRTV